MQTALDGLPTTAPYQELLQAVPSYTAPSAFMRLVEANMPAGNQQRGRIFELAFCEILKREGITPFYYQVRLALRPIIDFDVLLFQEPNLPWCFSLKTSFRERWKQSYLEAVILKGLYPAAKCYLVTLEGIEAARRKNSIAQRETPELEDCILATAVDLDNVVAELRRQRFNRIEQVRVFQGREVV